MRKHVLLRAVACFEGGIATDGLCPSGEASPLRSSPEKIAAYTLTSKDRKYIEYTGNTQDVLENENTETHSVLGRICIMLGSEMKDISYDNLLISDKIGNRSNREQAANSQKVPRGWANLAIEYNTERYRPNYISWGLVSLFCRERPDLKKGDYLLLPDASGKIRIGEEQLEGIILKTGEKVRLPIGGVTEGKRRMLVLRGMTNYYRSIR